MKKLAYLVLVGVLFAGCTSSQPASTTEPATNVQDNSMQRVNETAPTTESSTAMTINLDEQSSSGQSGTAVLEEQNGKLVVTLTLSGTPLTVAQPAHIHVGSCPTPGAVKFPLTDVLDGTSVTTLDTTLGELKTMGPLAINVHKSASESKVYTSCGNVQ